MSYKQLVGVCVDGSIAILTPLFAEIKDDVIMDCIKDFKFTFSLTPTKPLGYAFEHDSLPEVRLFNASFVDTSSVEILGEL